MIALQCYFFKKKQNLTVGDIQTVFCPLKVKEKNILKDKKDFFFNAKYPIPLLNYQLVLLQKPIVKQDVLSLSVTSYIPGVFKNVNPILKLEKNQFLLSGLNWKVKSVLQKQSKTQSYYGPIVEPNSLNVLYISIVFFSLFICYGLYFLVSRYKYKKIQKQEIIKYKKTISPYNEYHKSIRAMSLKSDDFFVELKNAFYVFLTRTTEIPFFQYSLTRLKKAIKSNKQLSLQLQNNLLFLVEDLTLTSSKINLEKKQSILNKLNKIVDQIEEVL
ncbi:MAG: hypothetical protein HAW63_04860 [Bdellovibrionaceae bacterium]|nr:hypothetical protein [Pseudobdellovibrionaceae bacterium]